MTLFNDLRNNYIWDMIDGSDFGLNFTSLISDPLLSSAQLAVKALQMTRQAFRTSTNSAHNTPVRTYISFVLFMDLPCQPSTHSILACL